MIVLFYLLSWIAASSQLDFSLIRKEPHDSNCFTQGLTYYDRYIFQSCGLTTKSELQKIDTNTGLVMQRYKFEDHIFAEGITVVNDVVFVLTWQNKLVFSFNVHTMQLIRSIPFESFNGEGWGLSNDRNFFILSDGSSTLSFYDLVSSVDMSEKWVPKKYLSVREGSRPVTKINELEYSNGYIFANIWYEDRIVQIDPETGSVVKSFDLADLYPKAHRSPMADCLNGIAYNTSSEQFLLTGKLWADFYHVKLLDIVPGRRSSRRKRRRSNASKSEM